MFYLYILHSSKTDRYYVGHTANLGDRLMRHNQGRSISTKNGIPWELKYTEEFASKEEAYARERQLKGWKSRVMLEKLIQDKQNIV